ncbi:TPA: hypothetical protein ACMY33_001293 [Yersinia enterocolitica]|nr:hypothetical protein [Yersinia enterocolitica]
MSENTDYETLKAERDSALNTCSLIAETLGITGAVAGDTIAKARELVAENAALQQACVHVYNAGYSRGHLNTVDGIPSCGDYEEDAFEALYEVAVTPSTTQAINEIKARGVDAFADDLGETIKGLPTTSPQYKAVKSIVFRAVKFAASLRGGQ